MSKEKSEKKSEKLIEQRMNIFKSRKINFEIIQIKFF